jgi:hypothetical protein
VPRAATVTTVSPCSSVHRRTPAQAASSERLELPVERINFEPEMGCDAGLDLAGRKNARAAQNVVAANAEPLGAQRREFQQRRIDSAFACREFGRKFGALPP